MEPIRVLVVEDDVDQAALIRRTLERHRPGFAVTVASDGPASLRVLEQEAPALVLLDYSLPGMNGVEVVRRVRERQPGVPVVLVTGQGDERIVAAAMDAGATDYIAKTSGYLTALPTVLFKVLKQHELAVENARLYRAAQDALAELRAAQETLVRGETLRALGELASGAAHHLNNLLAVVCGRVQLLLGRPDVEHVRRPLEIVERAARDGAEVVRRIQQFSRKSDEDERRLVDLNDLAADVIELTRLRWEDAARAQGIAIDVALRRAPLPPVLAHAASLREVLTNVLLNAVDALPRGGRIVIESAVADGWVTVAVSDDGVGMPPDVSRHAFEPFFTTKGVRSTGLGLSVSYGIVRRHGGDLEVESRTGTGTRVMMTLPVAATPAAPAFTAPDTGEPVARRVLIVDDDPDVLGLLADLLGADGHRVVATTSATEAIRRVEDDAGLDAVLTDLGMPEMTGWDLAAEIRRRRPDITLGLVTGWGVDVPAPEATGAVDFILPKPISSAELRRALARRVPAGSG